MKVLFFGTPKFAEIVLQGLLDSDHTVVGVVCQNDKVAGRGNKIKTPHIVEMANANNLPVYQFERLKDHIEDFKQIDYDVAVTASYGKILPKALLDLKLCLNIHPSLLPKYRGATPIQSALLNGDTLSGVTVMKTEVGLDDGDIYAQEEMQIMADDDYLTLGDKMAHCGTRMLLQVLFDIEEGKEKRTPQNEREATFVKLIEKSDAQLDFQEKASDLVNKVRAFVESPVAFFLLGEDRIKVFKASAADMGVVTQIGHVIEDKKRFLIQASDDVFEIEKCQASGGKVLEAKVFKNGYRFKSMVVKNDI